MKSRDIALSSLFGIVIFAQKMLLPGPYDKMITVLIQIIFLTLAFLVAGFMGPILTGFISGLLTASMRGGLGAMTFAFALVYGVLVSILNHLFSVVESGQIRRGRLTSLSVLSTLLVGVLSAFTSTALGLIPYNPVMISIIIVTGAVQGLVGGYLSGWVFEKYLRNLLN